MLHLHQHLVTIITSLVIAVEGIFIREGKTIIISEVVFLSPSWTVRDICISLYYPEASFHERSRQGGLNPLQVSEVEGLDKEHLMCNRNEIDNLIFASDKVIKDLEFNMAPDD